VITQVFKTGGIDQFQIDITDTAGGVTAVARDTGLVINDGQLLAREAVKQGRFADIGPADNGYF